VEYYPEEMPEDEWEHERLLDELDEACNLSCFDGDRVTYFHCSQVDKIPLDNTHPWLSKHAVMIDYETSPEDWDLTYEEALSEVISEA
jgi:hypothetical protein